MLFLFSLLILNAAALTADSLITPLGFIPLTVSDESNAVRFDHSVVVEDLLFLSATENDTVAIIDLNTKAFVDYLPVARPQGIDYSSAHELVFVASSEDGTLSAWSSVPPFAVAWTVPVGLDADNVRFENFHGGGRVWVASGGAENGDGVVTCVNASSGEIVTTVGVGPNHPEEMSQSSLYARLMVSVPNDATGGVIDMIDTSLGVVTGPGWSGGGAWAGPFAQHLDASGLRLWVSTRGDATRGIASAIVVLNALDGSTLWSTPAPSARYELDSPPCDDVQGDGGLALGALTFAACGGPASRLFIFASTQINRVTNVADAWENLGALSSATMDQGLVNARGLAWHARRRVLAVPVPLVRDAEHNQSARLLLFAVADNSAPDAGRADRGDGLGVPTWVAITLAVAIFTSGTAYVIGRRQGASAVSALYHADDEDIYGNLNSA
jgi:hypothetical protein